MNIHPKMVILFEKTMKPYFKAIILSLKYNENITVKTLQLRQKVKRDKTTVL